MKATRLDQVFDEDSRQIHSNYSHIGHMYTGAFSEYYYKRFDQALRCSNVDGSDRVLIVGGGTGVFALTLVDLVDELVFNDLAREDPLFATVRSIFDLASVDDENLRYVAADVEDLPFKSNTFDVVFALDVLEHVPDENSGIKEIYRVTKDGGSTIISAPIEIGPAMAVREGYRFIDGRRHNVESISEFFESLIGNPPLEKNQHHRGYDYRQTTALLRSYFSDVFVEYCPYPNLRWLNPTAIISAELDP
ncbi:class I SAM-dependent methyltransferase [Natrarchaeobius chitinivorans]|uniref:Class I SAM-dependent methyltransferase n=1 Tax=Natrarchaeobius chitinivorans TaxID=1679083 RepID=A0A3N6MBJ3_NATCH|nr:class I SAM-dependent methyltransferase [Natrarchaeobius chitinivorans]RQG93830.1 class I SAM-dependent methyltransferase [Natrarchaeobius chitinivorans]